MSGAYDQVHLGVGAASFGNVCIGLYGLWHNADNTTAFDQISGDLGLLISNDGVHFREPVKGHRFLRRDESPARPVPGHSFPTVLCQGNGILNVGDETRIYHGRWRNAGAYAKSDDVKYSSGEVALATLPRDRWGALGLNPDASEGTVCTDSMVLSADGQVVLNADGTDGIRVEIVDERFTPLPAFSGDRAGRAVGSGGFDCAVVWPGGSVAALAGQTVRLRLRLTRGAHAEPRLFAIYVKP